MENKRTKIIVIFFLAIFISILIGYLLLKVLPTRQAEIVVGKFEIAVRKDDKSLIEDVFSPNNIYLERVRTPKMYQHLQNLFGRFHEGVEVYKCKFLPSFLSENEKAQIFAMAKMKAKKDNKDRKHFQIELEKIGSEWKLVSFYFPDFIDY